MKTKPDTPAISGVWLVAIVILILVLDQALKFWVKTNMLYHEIIPILGLDWARLHFVENEGMAFGKRFNIPHGKLILSLFRLVAAGFLVYYLRTLLRTPKVRRGLLISFALILAGAVGNIIDSAFYGLIFTESFTHGLPATLVPIGEGYGTFLHGKVVDMFSFPLFSTTTPNWWPFGAGRPFTFFGAIFNLADVAISWGVIQIMLFHRDFFQQSPTQAEEQREEEE